MRGPTSRNALENMPVHGLMRIDRATLARAFGRAACAALIHPIQAIQGIDCSICFLPHSYSLVPASACLPAGPGGGQRGAG